ncbi:MAG: hypothetical protein R2788_11235 [Saprospiraceae bacterium]|jgi:hypothetical membrane protein
MNRRKFSFQLVLLTVVLTVAVLFLQYVPIFNPGTGFSLISIGFFFFLSLAMFLIAAKAAISKDKNAFTRLIILFSMGKMLLTVVLVVVYKLVIKPESIYFIIPFFGIYIAYTIFETIFMTKLGKVKAR